MPSDREKGRVVGERVRRLDEAIEWAAYREFALVHGRWNDSGE